MALSNQGLAPPGLTNSSHWMGKQKEDRFIYRKKLTDVTYLLAASENRETSLLLYTKMQNTVSTYRTFPHVHE